MMNENSEAIVLYCSHLSCGDGIVPLEPKEWSDLTKLLLEKKLTPAQLLACTETEICDKLQVGHDFALRLVRLAERGGSIAFELERYRNIGIGIVTRADREYPAKLKQVLGNKCPPLFYYAGDLSILGRATIGYVGSRRAEDEACGFAARTVEKTVGLGYGVVSGGAKGIDGVAGQSALERGSVVIEYLADSMTRRMKTGQIVKAIQNNALLLLSAVNPDAGFHVGNAMMRNRFIYAQSEATVVVKADLNTGGTWEGATDNLANGWCRELCWANERYPGNMKLIERGAIPIDDRWDGDPSSLSPPKQAVQVSFFDE